MLCTYWLVNISRGLKKKIVLSESRIAFCWLLIVQVKNVCRERTIWGERLGYLYLYILEWLRPYVVTTTSFWHHQTGYSVSVTMKQTSHPVNSKTQQKITYIILYLVKSDWFYSIQIWALKRIFNWWKPFKRCFKSPQTLWNHDTNVKKILASLAQIFSCWNSFYNSFEVCFNFSWIILVRLIVKERKLWCSKVIIITHHHVPTWWVACNF